MRKLERLVRETVEELISQWPSDEALLFANMKGVDAENILFDKCLSSCPDDLFNEMTFAIFDKIRNKGGLQDYVSENYAQYFKEYIETVMERTDVISDKIIKIREERGYTPSDR